ncbi:hypothetical protein EYR41_004394 [Orbilia oligospora]|uniref:Uncharacterized protein n=1 Tax=Orbilia oligospora TaxID=2813651 RepID=A0A7C8P622_ORBOL|nr:hypothetical protein TWF751_001623 [Orbilia oligospora]TGJ72504.1 hypothetical protein EYR41_004394 [Orbilia oligospora]
MSTGSGGSRIVPIGGHFDLFATKAFFTAYYLADRIQQDHLTRFQSVEMRKVNGILVLGGQDSQTLMFARMFAYSGRKRSHTVTKRMPVAPAGVPNGPDFRESDDVSHRISRRFANSQEKGCQPERRFERRAVCISLLLNLQLQSIKRFLVSNIKTTTSKNILKKASDRFLAWGWLSKESGLG